MAKKRNRRTDQAVKEAIAELIEEEIADPRVEFVTITDAEVSEDRRSATVYYTALEPGVVSPQASEKVPEEDAAAAGLESAAPRIQGLLARRLRLRNTPAIRFVPDTAAAEGRRIEELLRRMKDEEVPGER
ncbi:MAG: 30S ribosome-binding factor RbfA [Nitriliruptorales bacterium]